MATDKEGEIENYFFYFSAKTNAVGTQSLNLSTQNIYSDMLKLMDMKLSLLLV